MHSFADSLDPLDYFTGRADVYASSRPRYAVDALAAILDGLPDHPAVADVGSGTGIAARNVAALGARVTCVEPNGDMIRRAAADDTAKTCRYVRGRAEDTGLANASLDA